VRGKENEVLELRTIAEFSLLELFPLDRFLGSLSSPFSNLIVSVLAKLSILFLHVFSSDFLT